MFCSSPRSWSICSLERASRSTSTVDGAGNLPACLRDHRFLDIRTRRFDPVAPIGGAAVSLAIFDRREDALEKRIPLHASEKCFPFGPVNPDSGELSVAGGERRLEDGD